MVYGVFHLNLYLYRSRVTILLTILSSQIFRHAFIIDFAQFFLWGLNLKCSYVILFIKDDDTFKVKLMKLMN